VEVARLLTQIALDAGGRDNITVIVIPVPTPAEVPT
jgi:serine/threonine protein phosphatase PrpC